MKPSEWLRTHMWIKHKLLEYGNPFDPCEATGGCLLGSIDVLARKQIITEKQKDKMIKTLYEVIYKKYGREASIGDANDRYVKTKEEAIALLEEAEKCINL